MKEKPQGIKLRLKIVKLSQKMGSLMYLIIIRPNSYRENMEILNNKRGSFIHSTNIYRDLFIFCQHADEHKADITLALLSKQSRRRLDRRKKMSFRELQLISFLSPVL